MTAGRQTKMPVLSWQHTSNYLWREKHRCCKWNQRYPWKAACSTWDGDKYGQIWKHNYYLDHLCSLQHLKSQKPSVILHIKSSSCQNNWKTKAITQGYDNSVQETFSTSTYTSSRCSCTSPRCITASVRGFTTYAQVKWAVWEASRHIWQTTCYLPVQSSVCSLSSPLGIQQKLLRGPSVVLYRMMYFSHRVLGKGVTNKSTLLLEWFYRR